MKSIQNNRKWKVNKKPVNFQYVKNWQRVEFQYEIIEEYKKTPNNNSCLLFDVDDGILQKTAHSDVKPRPLY